MLPYHFASVCNRRSLPFSERLRPNETCVILILGWRARYGDLATARLADWTRVLALLSHSVN